MAFQLGIEVRYKNLAHEGLCLQSAACKLLSRSSIIIDSRYSAWERARLLARELAKYALENFYILPRIRDFISLYSSGLEKNLPHK